MLPDASGAFFCISCSRCQVNKCGFCDLCSSSPRCLNDSEAPLHMRVCEYVSLMMEGEKESLYLFYFSPSSLFNLLSFRKFHTEECSSWECAALVFPVADWLQLSCQSNRASPERQCRGTRLPAHYALLSREQRGSHSHNVFCITGNFLKFPVINLANSIFCGLIHLAS